MTVRESLLALSAYPVPLRTVEVIALKRGNDPDSDVSESTLSGREYKLAVADVYRWLSLAPNVGQGGQSYSFSTEEKKQFRAMAQAIYNEEGEPLQAGGQYGYMGDKL